MFLAVWGDTAFMSAKYNGSFLPALGSHSLLKTFMMRSAVAFASLGGTIDKMSGCEDQVSLVCKRGVVGIDHE